MAVSKGTRIFAGGMALLFLLTASTFTVAVIYDMVSGDNQTNNTPAQQQGLAGTQLNDFQPIDNIEELKTIDQQEGKGATAQKGDVVTVHYTGAVADTGVIFQSSLDTNQPVPLTLKSGPGGVIEGWVKGIPGMKEGGTRRLLIPADLAYGQTPPPNSGIQPGADLVFDVTLISIGQ